MPGHLALRSPTRGRASILILLILITRLNQEASQTSRPANVLRDKPCGRASAELLFPFIPAAETSADALKALQFIDLNQRS
jgi:hypothetical protein